MPSSGSSSSMGRSSGGKGFDDERGTLAAADAGGAQPVAGAAPPERMQQVRGDPRSAGPERVAEGDRAPIHVGALAVEAELTLDREVLRGERLVDLDQVHVLERESRVGQRPS